MKRLLVLTAAIFGLISSASAKPVSANITLDDDSQFACFIVAADANNITYSMNESGQGVSVVPRVRIKHIITRPPEEWTEAENAYNSGDLEAAETQFKALSEEYAPIAALQDEYGSLAKFFYLQTLKKNGKLSLLADEIDKMRSQTIVLSKTYAENAKWLVPWGYIGKGNWDGLIAFVAAFEDLEGKKDNTSVPFKLGVPKAKVAELAYFRGIATEKKGDPKAAVNDYYRALTTSYGGDRQISKEAILALLNITKTAEAETPSYFNKTELHSLAMLYQLTFGNETLPPEYIAFLTAPPVPGNMQPPPAEETKPEEGDPPAPEKPEAEKPEAEKPAEEKPAEEKPAEEKPAES